MACCNKYRFGAFLSFLALIFAIVACGTTHWATFTLRFGSYASVSAQFGLVRYCDDVDIVAPWASGCSTWDDSGTFANNRRATLAFAIGFIIMLVVGKILVRRAYVSPPHAGNRKTAATIALVICVVSGIISIGVWARVVTTKILPSSVSDYRDSIAFGFSYSFGLMCAALALEFIALLFHLCTGPRGIVGYIQLAPASASTTSVSVNQTLVMGSIPTSSYDAPPPSRGGARGRRGAPAAFVDPNDDDDDDKLLDDAPPAYPGSYGGEYGAAATPKVFCSTCGSQVLPETRFCPSCGHRV